MSSLRFGTRLLLSFWLVLLLAIGVPGGYIYHSLKQDVISTSVDAAEDSLTFVAWLMGQQPPFSSDAALDQWSRLLAEKLGYRITIIEFGGRVVADSNLDWENVQQMPSHAYREEIAAAFRTGRGSSIRYSETLERNLIYAAQRINLEDRAPSLVLRIAMPFSEVENRLSAYARQFWGVNALILLITLALSVYFARRLKSPIDQIIARMQKLDQGDYSQGYIAAPGQEFYHLSGNLNEMAERISRQVETITRQRHELAAIIENMREGLLLLDPDGRVKAVNHVAEEIAGCRRACIGKTPMEIFLNHNIQDACNSIIAGGPARQLILELEKDLFYEVYLNRIAEGGALVVFYNISERKQLEKIRRDFVANVSHELKTPLTSIRGYVETLLSEPFSFNAEATSFLQIIDKNARHMAEIVDDLLKLTRLQDKPLLHQLQPVNASTCFAAAWDTARPMAQTKDLKLDNQLAGHLEVMADESALRQVFGNLLDNAIRYSPPNKTITVLATAKDATVIFCIQDEGPGIAPSHQARIFERFYRVEKERSRISGGTGLGLAICKNAVTGMGGDIWLQSPPDGQQTGSVFFFSLVKASVRQDSN